jgi:hypothetical protein
MKKILLIVLTTPPLVQRLLCQEAQSLARQLVFDTLPLHTGPQKINLLQIALTKAQQTIDMYAQQVSQESFLNTLAYMKFYRSWYQSVTPAPRQVYEALNEQDHKFINVLKKIAQPFMQEPSSIPGASSLSQQGDIFYQQVIALMENKIKTF